MFIHSKLEALGSFYSSAVNMSNMEHFTNWAILKMPVLQTTDMNSGYDIYSGYNIIIIEYFCYAKTP